MNSPQAFAAPPLAPEYDSRRWIALAAVLCATFLGVLDFLIVNIAIPSIRAHLNTTDADIQLTVAVYGLSYAVGLITGGRLGDIYGRKKMFLIGMAGFLFASVLCGLAQSPAQLIAARVLQGTLASLMSPQVLSIIQVSFPPEEKRLAFALMGAVVGSGSFIGNVLGGWLVEADIAGLGWRPIFFVNVPIGLFALVATWFLVRETTSPAARRLDLPGVAILSPALFAVIFPLAEGRERGWPLWTWISLALSAILFYAFVKYEKKVEREGGSPLVELHLFQERSFSAGLLSILSIFSGMGAFALALTLFLQDGIGLSPAQAGWTFAPLSVSFFVASLLAVRLQRRLGSRVVQAGLALMMVGQIAIIAAALLGNLDARLLTAILFVYGSGQGLAVPALISTVLSDVHGDDAGSASGVLTTTQQIAFSIGVAIIGGAFFSVLGHHPDRAAYSHAVSVALACNFVLLGVTFGLVGLLPRFPRAATGPNVPVEA